MKNRTGVGTVASAALIAALLLPATARPHCDTLDGPVVRDARAALDSGDVSGVLKWVRPSDEPAIRGAFTRAREVRQLAAPARELADRFFFETLVRVHRAGEGAPYTGLKESGEPVEPGIAAADAAIASGAVDPLVNEVTRQVATELRGRLARLATARTRAAATTGPDAVTAGRAWVAEYVTTIHYVERLLAPAAAEPAAEPAHAAVHAH